MTAQTTELTKANETAIATFDEAENILHAAREHAGFEKLLRFRKGKFSIGEEEILLGTELLAHPEAWTKCWIKFDDGKVADRQMYRIALGERPLERHELGDEDQTTWTVGPDGRPTDPWSLQNLLPFENPSSGEVIVFTSSSIGGARAISELCEAWARRKKKGNLGQPIVKLQSTEMPTKKFGKVPRPKFEIVGWNDDGGDFVDERPAVASEEEFQVQIPL